MSLDSKDIHDLCDLARIEIAADGLEDVVTKLRQIVGLVDQLQAVDTTGVEPLAHPLDRPQRLRDDRVTESNERETLQRNAQEVARGLYLVPKVLD
jgi:aspartyl-tRNA(Asn)/glutamyl-tRNA(Gln) amidotransferase subunit C